MEGRTCKIICRERIGGTWRAYLLIGEYTAEELILFYIQSCANEDIQYFATFEKNIKNRLQLVLNQIKCQGRSPYVVKI